MARRPQRRDCRQPEGHGAAAPGLAPGGQGMWISHPDILYRNNAVYILVLHGTAAGEQCQPNGDRVQRSPRGAASRQTLPAMVTYGGLLAELWVGGGAEPFQRHQPHGIRCEDVPQLTRLWRNQCGGTSPRAGTCRRGSNVGLSLPIVWGAHTASREDIRRHSSLG